MSRRTIALVVAVVLAAVAAIALVSYIQGVEDEALGEGELVQIFVAKDAIPAGTTAEAAGQRGLLERRAVPRQFVVTGAVGAISQIQGKVASVNIAADEQLIASRFVARGQARAGELIAIPTGRVAMSVDVSLVPGVAGFIQQGDRVSVLAQLTVPRGGGSTANEPRVQFVLQNIEVLAVGRRVAATERGETSTRQSDRIILTLAVRPGQAERLGFATLEGSLYFTLLPQGARAVSTSGRTARNAFPR